MNRIYVCFKKIALTFCFGCGIILSSMVFIKNLESVASSKGGQDATEIKIMYDESVAQSVRAPAF